MTLTLDRSTNTWKKAVIDLVVRPKRIREVKVGKRLFVSKKSKR